MGGVYRKKKDREKETEKEMQKGAFTQSKSMKRYKIVKIKGLCQSGFVSKSYTQAFHHKWCKEYVFLKLYSEQMKQFKLFVKQSIGWGKYVVFFNKKPCFSHKGSGS